EPKILFTVDGHPYKGKTFDDLANVEKIAKGIPSLERIVVVPYIREEPDIGRIPNSTLYVDFMSQERHLKIRFEQLPSNHPVYIMF
ncbi:acetoacetate--CoA ligase, partial [Candidatus Bathyarchaeota archaeon]|nr:acetoacetate--CoA ligase [Candidatus Bathyarchaeota archaeon]